MVGSLALLFGVAYGLTRLAVWAKRRLLWRVRRKLILSYVFVGVVPALLVITFFLLAGLILAFNVSSYLVQSRVRNLTDQARFLAQTVLLEVQRSGHAGSDRRSARAAPGQYRNALSVCLAGRDSRDGPGVQTGPGPPRARTTHAAGDVADRGRAMGPPAAAGHAAEVGRLRRIRRHHRLQHLLGQRRRRAGADAARDAGGGVARSARSRPGPLVLDMPMSTAIESRIQQETGITPRRGHRVPRGRRAADQAAGTRGSSRRSRRRPGAVAAPGALGRVSRSRRLADRRARKRIGRHPDQHLGNLRPHLGGVADGTRPHELRPDAAVRAGARGVPVPGDPVRGAGHRLRAGAANHRRGARSVYRHATRAGRQLRPPDSRCARAISWASLRSRST